ncbi:hypothetical protein DL98DRAFT_180110 [Cadophora sp. DSE1049]|nr:hypothetical protein DL98DRAFT_180110 [Cadophora sp. DSE1049]
MAGQSWDWAEVTKEQTILSRLAVQYSLSLFPGKLLIKYTSFTTWRTVRLRSPFQHFSHKPAVVNLNYTFPRPDLFHQQFSALSNLNVPDLPTRIRRQRSHRTSTTCPTIGSKLSTACARMATSSLRNGNVEVKSEEAEFGVARSFPGSVVLDDR